MKVRLLMVALVGSAFGFAAPASAQEEVGSVTQDICCGGACCLIDGSCRSTEEANPADACEFCDPAQSQTGWSQRTTPACSGGTDAGGGGTDAGGGGGDDGGCSVGHTGDAPYGLLGLLGLVLLRRRRR